MIHQGVLKVNIDDNIDLSNDMSGARPAEEMNNKKCTSREQNLEHTKTNEISGGDAGGSSTGRYIVSESISNAADAQTCANCGKEGANNTCNKCKMTKYCNAACKKKHRHKHKKECEEHLRGAAELREEELKHAAKLRDIELFKQPPQKDDDCPICFQRLPYLDTGKRYKACCGKVICSGCIHAVQLVDGGLCPFCRIPMAGLDEKDVIKGLQKSVEADDADDTTAMVRLGSYYFQEKKASQGWKRGSHMLYIVMAPV